MLSASSPRLVEAVLAGGANGERPDGAACATNVLEVHLAGGVRIEVGDATQLKLAVSLLKVLGVERSC